MSEDQNTKSSFLRIALHPAVIAVFGVVTAFVGWQAIHESSVTVPVYSYREMEYELIQKQNQLVDQLKTLQSQNDDLKKEVNELNDRLCAVEKKVGKKCPKQSVDVQKPPKSGGVQKPPK